jgi:hypothetical protein
MQAFSMTFDDGGMVARLKSMQERWKPEKVLDAIGRRLVRTEIGGDPLWDRGILANSFIWRVEGGTRLIVGTAHPGAKTLNLGAPPVMIRPKNGKWLTIPFGPNLSTTERQTFKLTRYKGVFFRSRGDRLLAFVNDGGSPKLIAVLVRGIGGPGEPQIKKREFLSWRLYGGSALKAATSYLEKGEAAISA